MADKFVSTTRRYYKTNFVDILESLTPDIYQEEDLNLSGDGLNPISEIINCHINIANDISSVIPISSIPGTQTENLNNITGISQYFVKQNRLTNIGPYDFETKILLPLGTTFADFETKEEFISYLSGNLLPKITLPQESIQNAIQSNINTLSALTENANASSVHNYLVDTLGWFYFLNSKPYPRKIVNVGILDATSFQFTGDIDFYSTNEPFLQAGTIYRFVYDLAVPAASGLYFSDGDAIVFEEYITRVGTPGTAGSYIDFYVTSDVLDYFYANRGSVYSPLAAGVIYSDPSTELAYTPSSYVLESLADLYTGRRLETIDGIKGLTEFIWKNTGVRSFSTFIPEVYVSGYADTITSNDQGATFDSLGTFISLSALNVATYTSGTQKLDALNTLIEVIYSPLYIDQSDFTVKNAFDSFLDSGLILDDRKSKGPHRKFLNMLGYELADLTDQVENIGLIYDVENVRDEHLQYIADLIGFKLRGNSPAKWRHQLLTAIRLYKSSGTLAAIQSAINSLIVDSVFDVSGKVQELWESYVPHLIWYALGTESPLFKNLNTWNRNVALKNGVYEYNEKSLEDNLKIVTDSIILDLYRNYPNNFIFNNKRFNPPRLIVVDSISGEELELYTYVGEPNMKPFHVRTEGFEAYKQDARKFGESAGFEAATGYGPFGYGVYLAGEGPSLTGERPTYLKFVGDLTFLFNYRGKTNYPLPPFEEVKYYRDCGLTGEMVSFLVERLKCFKVRDAFADEVGEYLLQNVVSNNTDLGSLNEWLMFFTSLQTPPNFNEVMSNTSDFEKNLLNLWCGKSSHLFINFPDSDFDFTKTTLEGDGRYGLYEAARVAREFAPAHAITRVNISGSSLDNYITSSTKYDYVNLDHDDTKASYTSASVLTNFEYSGGSFFFAAGGGDNNVGSDGGRGGLNTFKRAQVDSILDTLLSSTQSITNLSNVARRDLRRRNYKYTLPHEGYYDRTGFNGPVSFDPSVLEYSMGSSLGEFTLGYVASAAKFHPVVDSINPSGVWNYCEGLESSRTFSGVSTSSTFPYRGLYSLGSNAKVYQEGSRSSRYVDRGQVPQIYITMNKLLYERAKALAENIVSLSPSSYIPDEYWKNHILSIANQAFASGYTLNSFADYENFRFGNGLHKLHRDYCKYFAKHSLNPVEMDNTGGNIFAHVFGKGLFNCHFDIDGSAVSSFVLTNLESTSAINSSTVWKSGGTGTYIASSAGQSVIPLLGTFTQASAFHAEFRNPHILSGVEFCDISGAPTENQFQIFRLDPSTSTKGSCDCLIDNTVIKSKSVGGLPRIRFDLSSYGDRRNYFIKDHKFNLKVKALVGDEADPVLGGGQLGIWIHTQPVSGLLWSWTSRGKWEFCRESDISINFVKQNLSHVYNFETKLPVDIACLGNFTKTTEFTNNLTLKNIKEDYFETVSIDFDTRNFTTNNNSEYLQIIPIQESEYQITQQVNRDNTNYIVEVFFMPNDNNSKYLLIDSVQLQDKTLREYAGIGKGFGVETSGIPLTPFVQEYMIYLEKPELRDILKFYNSLAGLESGVYSTNLASRNATLTSGVLEVSGGSRLNYRIHPEWAPHTKDGTYGYYTSLELDN